MPVDGGYLMRGARSESSTATPPFGAGVRGRAMDVPGPQVFWMSDWGRWLTLSFQVLAIAGPARSRSSTPARPPT